MSKPYSAQLRFRALALICAGKTNTQIAYKLGVSTAALDNWIRQDHINRGEISALTSWERDEPGHVKKRIRKIEYVIFIWTEEQTPSLQSDLDESLIRISRGPCRSKDPFLVKKEAQNAQCGNYY